MVGGLLIIIQNSYFKFKKKRISTRARELYDAHLMWQNKTWNNTEKLYDLSTKYYRDSDVPKLLPDNMLFSP